MERTVETTVNQSTKRVQSNPGVILLVEDDQAMRSLLCDEIWDMGCRIVEAADGHQALQCVTDAVPDLIITDLRMPAGGLDYVQRLRVVAPNCPIILMTAFGDSKTKVSALQSGVAAYFDKPVRIGELKSAITRLLGEPRPGDGRAPAR